MVGVFRSAASSNGATAFGRRRWRQAQRSAATPDLASDGSHRLDEQRRKAIAAGRSRRCSRAHRPRATFRLVASGYFVGSDTLGSSPRRLPEPDRQSRSLYGAVAAVIMLPVRPYRFAPIFHRDAELNGLSLGKGGPKVDATAVTSANQSTGPDAYSGAA